jgi:hypothetical protein
MQACTTCHLPHEPSDSSLEEEGSAPPHNAFGLRLAEVVASLPQASRFSDIPAGLRIIGDEDADGDGVANSWEILAGRSPGSPQDMPTMDELSRTQEKWRHRARETPYPWQPFLPVQRPKITVLEDQAHRNPIDALIAIEHRARGLTPRPPADRAILLRRLSVDLVGLPPTPDELDTFLQDNSPDAYEKVVDRLLASSEYGVRWGRHWMDVWRYSDWAGWTDGKQIRDSQPHIWRWRDWIIESLNEDKPYDQMVAEMLAADELAPSDQSALRGTGFLARNYKMLSRETWMQDAVQHTMQAFLGLTVGCARCHDHLYDPISQAEYYQLRALFEPHQVRIDPVPGVLDTTQDGVPRVYDEQLSAVTYFFRRGDERDPDKDRPQAPGVLSFLGGEGFSVKPVSLPPEAYYPARRPSMRKDLISAAETETKNAGQSLKEAQEELVQAKKSARGQIDLSTIDIAQMRVTLAKQIAVAAKGRQASVLARFAADDAKYADPPGENLDELAAVAAQAERDANVAQAEVDCLKAEISKATATLAKTTDSEKSVQAVAAAEKLVLDNQQKLEAARKLAHEASREYSPLSLIYPKVSTGRRLALARWITSRDNPLAARVAVNQIWLRHFGQALVPTVLDFGQNGQAPAMPALVDWLAAELMEPTSGFRSATPPAAWSMKHLHRLIVTSEAYRRASTPDAENLPIDPDNRWFWRMPSRRIEAELVRDSVLYVAGQLDLTQGGPDIDHRHGLTSKRRSIYFQSAQEKQMEFLKLFDCAAVTECYQRKESIVPQQALALANSELTWVHARIIARQLQNADDREFALATFKRVLARPATKMELELTEAFLADQRNVLQASGVGEQTVNSTNDFSQPATEIGLRARENLVHVLLNHHDFVTLR